MEAHEELFDLYINNQLSASEKEEFEERLANDEEFKLEYELHLDISKSVKHLGKSVIIEQLQEIEYNLKNKGSLEDYKPTKGSGGIFGAGKIWIWLFFITMGIGIAAAVYFVSKDPHLNTGENYFKSCNQLYVKIIDDREMDNHRIAFEQSHHDTTADISDTATEKEPMKVKYFNDTVNVCIIYSDTFNFHYTYFNDTLNLYGNLMQSLIQFASKPENKYGGYYNLIYNNELFELIPHTSKITKLERLTKEDMIQKTPGDGGAVPVDEEDIEEYGGATSDDREVDLTLEQPSKIKWDSIVVVKLVPKPNKQYLPEPTAWGTIIKKDTVNNEVLVTRKLRFRDIDKFQDKYSVVLINLSEEQNRTPTSNTANTIKQDNPTTSVIYNNKIVLPDQESQAE